jgi:hypothetical protein
MRKLSGKTRDELASILADKPHAELVELIYRLVTFERLLTAREIADASHVSRNDVLADMKAGRFVDPIFGPGFFCRGIGFRVTTTAANHWREGFFVRPGDGAALPSEKKPRTEMVDVERAYESNQPLEDQSETDVERVKTAQRAIRQLSADFIAGDGK